MEKNAYTYIQSSYFNFSLLACYHMKKSPATPSKAADFPKTDVYEIVTNRIILALEGGIIPWKQCWSAAHDAPRNYQSGHVYTGINALLLGMQQAEKAYYLTFAQARALGGCVRKGEKGLPVVFFMPTKREDDKGKEKKGAILRYSTVFNVSQIDGIEWKLHELPSREHTPHEAAELLVKNYPSAPSIKHAGSSAVYRTSTDTVTMPEAELFATVEDYYQTLFHELAHSTGHKSRLNRDTLTEVAAFGSATYAKEELVAEIGAAMLSGAAGLDMSVTEKSTTAYLQNWLTALRNDKKLIISAASQAQKATNYIRGIVASYEAAPQE